MILEDFLEEKLAHYSVRLVDFSELLIRLLDYGVLCRDESQVECQLYDRYLSVKHVVEEYLHILHIRIEHDEKFQYVRLYPPGATVSNLQDDMHAPFNHGFRVKPSHLEMCVILTLRVEYEKALKEGLIDDKGSVVITLEQVILSLHSLLGRQLPEHITERKHLFSRLRQLRLIRLSTEDDLPPSDTWLSIHPSITSFISPQALQALHPSTPEETPTPPQEQ